MARISTTLRQWCGLCQRVTLTVPCDVCGAPCMACGECGGHDGGETIGAHDD